MDNARKMFYLIIALSGVLFSRVAMAFDPKNTGLTTTGGAAGYNPDANIMQQVGSVVSAFLAVLGVILFVIIFYGGILYMTAGGDTKRVDEGKKYIINGIIGVVIISLAYALSTYVLSRIVTATTG